MSRAHDLAWCAGFFDGEGWITIQRRSQKYKDKVYESLYLRIGINHVAPEPLHEINRVLGGKLRFDKDSHLRNKDGCNRKPRYAWTASCNEAKEILVQLMPYFKNKNTVAELGIEFQNTMATSRTETPIEVVMYRQLLKEKISMLNAKD